MKVKRLYLNDVSVALGHKKHVDGTLYKIEQVDNGFIVDDKVFIPNTSVIEALVEIDIELKKLKVAKV